MSEVYYHLTTEENANKIRESGKMSAKEDGIFFSTKEFGDNSTGYGEGVVKVKVPVEKLVLDDIFNDEAHLRIPLKNRNAVLDVTSYLVKPDTVNSLSVSGNQIAPVGSYNVYGKDIALEQDIGPVREDMPTTKVNEPFAEEYAPLTEAEANEIRDKLRLAGIRAESDVRSEKIGYKIRAAQLEKVPYMLVVGEKKAAEGKVAVRTRAAVDLGALSVDEFLLKTLEDVRTLKLD